MQLGKRITKHLLLWVVGAIVLGTLGGIFLPKWAIVPFATFDDIFGKFLGFAVPLIILALVAPAIADLGRGAGKWLVITAVLAYGSTLFAGFATLFIGKSVFAWLLAGERMKSLAAPEDAVGSLLGENFALPPAFGVMTALLLAFVFGVGMAACKTPTLRDWFEDFRVIILALIQSVIVPLLPLYIFGIFMNMAKSGQIAAVIVAMLKVVVFCLLATIVLLVLQYLVAGAIAAVNPFTALGRMMKAYATALGTSSSAATIPVTYECTLKNGVSPEVAGFTIPLCATIHLSGSTVKITAFALAVSQMMGLNYSFATWAAFIAMLGITMVAAPGVPGGAITAAQGVLQSILGFTDPMYALMVATYIAIDSFGTATNVTGDGAIALIVNRLARGKIKRSGESATLEETAGAATDPLVADQSALKGISE